VIDTTINMYITKILTIIFLAFMIPNIAVYAYHMQHEFHESQENATHFKETSNEQFGEGIFFLIVTIGYVIMTIWVLIRPKNTIPYLVILIGTVVIIVIYYLSKTSGVPILDGFDNWIIDDSTNWKDAVTKIAQQAMVIPLAMLLVLNTTNKKINSTK
jgi:hypothetical protein